MLIDAKDLEVIDGGLEYVPIAEAAPGSRVVLFCNHC